MRFAVPLFLCLATAALQTALTASLQSAEREEINVGELTELQKRDQMEFEAAQMEAAELEPAELKEVQNEKSYMENRRFLEAGQDENAEEIVETKDEEKDDGNENVDTGHEESESEFESIESTDELKQTQGKLTFIPHKSPPLSDKHTHFK
ncbi:uncharacterized protein LOC134034298 isoform X3 [Osmerus eperlanus]|uniref:uncharacterized protein LOC134034298 isoform X3 n=1 Tax=Osmerus eperlanus TaxID=29151 RepID=UPI002E14E431